MSFLMRFEKSGPTQKVQVKQRNLRRKTGEVVVQPAHTETRKKAAPKPKADTKPSAEKALAKPRASLKAASPVEAPKPAKVWINEDDLPKLQAKINDLNKRAKRIGTDPITLELGETKKVKLQTRFVEDLWRGLVEVTVNGPEPRYADWQFVAALKPLTSGNMVFAIGDQEIPRKYRKADMTCDHCGTKRKRNATYIIRSTETGEYKQVGRSCLKDFMGHGDPARFADFLAAIAEFVKEVEDWGDDGDTAYWDNDELPSNKYFSIEKYLGYVVASIERHGWTSRAEAQFGDYATADAAADWMFPPKHQRTEPVPEKALRKAKAALAWIRKKPEKWATTNYLQNLRLLCKEDVIGADEIGIAASLITVYDREKESERRERDIAAGKGSKHVGAVGERRDFRLKITSIKPYDGNYGMVYITKLLDDDGNEFTWFASNEPGEEGKTYNITATVKKHDEFRGIPQTHITRGKVKGLAKSFALVFRKAVKDGGPTQKVTVKTRALRQKTGKVVVQPAHTETRKKAAPKADAVKVRNTAGLTQRQMDRIHKLLESGQAEITKPGAKYLVRVRPEGQSRYSRLGEFASMADALNALAERMAVKATGKSERTYKDVGEKIGGARKDIANARDRFANNPTEANLKKLESEDPDAARRTCNRATIWPAPTVESMRAAGRSNVFIMGAMTVYSCIPAKFDSLSASDRLNYFRAVTMLRDFVEGATSSKELRERLEGISQELRATSKWVHYEKWKAAGAQFIKEPPPPPTEYQVALATALVHTPVLLKWLDGKAKRDLTFYSWKHTYVSAEDGQDFHAYGTIDGKHRQLTPEEAAARAEEWAGKVVDGKFVPKQRTKSAEEVTETQQRWERTVPTGYERKGGKAIHIRRPDDYLKRFGLRGVEFGNWMDHDASRIHVDRCAEAFQDMADLLGISATDLSLNGRLALAFGARGTGKAAAHYEPGKVVINLTKMGGAGTLGHEWAHFFDHIVGQFETGTNGQYLSHSRGATPVLDACGKVMKLIYHGTGRVELKPTDAEVPEKHGTYDYYLKSAGNNAQAAVDLIDKRYRFTDEARQQMVNYICKKTKAKSVTVSSSDSQFYSASIIQQGGKAKGYWTRPHEMFARAFETYLLDLMKEKRRENNYLVYVGKDSDAELRPYPRGEERKLLKAAFDELFAAVRAGDTLQKALSALQKATDTTSVRGSTQRTRTGVRVQPAYRAQRSKAVAKVTTPKGNVQYQYDEETLAAAKAEKFRRVAHLAKQLPRIVEAVKSDLAQGDTPQSKVVAAIVALIDRCCFRIGTDEYAEKHGTYGVTTLSPEHVTVDGATIRFQFTGKKQVPWDTTTTDPDLADFIAHLASDAPADRLFWYHRDGRQYPIRANHVNDWLRDYGVSAKDFRTYHATRLCFEELKRLSSRQPLAKKEIKQRVKQAVAATAERLGHTPAVCRQSYILPAVIDDFEANGGRLSIDPWKTARNMGKSFLLAFGGNAQ